MRAAERLGGARPRSPRRASRWSTRIGKQGAARCGAGRRARRHGYMFARCRYCGAPTSSTRRWQLMQTMPRDARPHATIRRMVGRAPAAGAQAARRRRSQDGLSGRARCGLAARENYASSISSPPAGSRCASCTTRTALAHFARIQESSDNPTSPGPHRLLAWGAPPRRMGSASDARTHYQEAARFRPPITARSRAPGSGCRACSLHSPPLAANSAPGAPVRHRAGGRVSTRSTNAIWPGPLMADLGDSRDVARAVRARRAHRAKQGRARHAVCSARSRWRAALPFDALRFSDRRGAELHPDRAAGRPHRLRDCAQESASIPSAYRAPRRMG